MYIDIRVYKRKDPELFELFHLGYPLVDMAAEVLAGAAQGRSVRIHLDNYRSIWTYNTVPEEMGEMARSRKDIRSKELAAFLKSHTSYQRNKYIKKLLLSSITPFPECVYLEDRTLREKAEKRIREHVCEDGAVAFTAPGEGQYADGFNKYAAKLSALCRPEEAGRLDEGKKREFVRLFRKLPLYLSRLQRLAGRPYPPGLSLKEQDYNIYLAEYQHIYEEYKDDPRWQRLFRTPKLEALTKGKKGAGKTDGSKKKNSGSGRKKKAPAAASGSAARTAREKPAAGTGEKAEDIVPAQIQDMTADLPAGGHDDFDDMIDSMMM